MPDDKDISRFFDEPGASPSEFGRSKKNTPAAVPKPRRNKQPTGLRIDADLYDELRIFKWKMLLPSMTATLDRALSEFRDNHKTELDEAKAQLGENGLRELFSRKD
jgi:hypothetical protein